MRNHEVTECAAALGQHGEDPRAWLGEKAGLEI